LRQGSTTETSGSDIVAVTWLLVCD
jgi:hypothetical protein